MDIYKDDCNESELYSEECMTEDWTGETDWEWYSNVREAFRTPLTNTSTSKDEEEPFYPF